MVTRVDWTHVGLPGGYWVEEVKTRDGTREMLRSDEEVYGPPADGRTELRHIGKRRVVSWVPGRIKPERVAELAHLDYEAQNAANYDTKRYCRSMFAEILRAEGGAQGGGVSRLRPKREEVST